MQAEERLKALIKSKGAISVGEYMAFCLYDEVDGYYRKKQPIGASGDFTTAPEISQIFGEMIAVWLLNFWQENMDEVDVTLAELGPGRGVLMADMLRVISKFSEVKKHFQVLMVEVSEALKKKQQEKLSTSEIPISWKRDLENLPKKPTIIIANEFLDALPVEHAIFDGANWWHRFIELADDQLQFGSGDMVDVSEYLQDYGTPEDGDILEYSPNAEAVINQISKHIKTYGGCALLIDYGYFKPAYGETLQALKKHKFHDVLHSPTEVDLTTHVNFKILRDLAIKNGCKAYITTQSGFLKAMGAELRTDQLAEKSDTKTAQNLCVATKRLVDKNQMGELFKCLVIASNDVEKIYGFGS